MSDPREVEARLEAAENLIHYAREGRAPVAEAIDGAMRMLAIAEDFLPEDAA